MFEVLTVWKEIENKDLHVPRQSLRLNISISIPKFDAIVYLPSLVFPGEILIGKAYTVASVSLRHALLGVIKDTPLTGYDLVRHFQGTVGFLWSAPQSQIYPELRRMEAEGLVEAKVAPRGRRAQKRIYSVTEAGMAELRRWATDFMPLPAQRDPIVLKAAFFDLAPLESVREQLRAHIAQFQWRMEQWQAREDAIRERRAELVEVWLSRQPVEEHDNIIELKLHALEGLIGRARAEICWARQGLALCDEIEARRESHNGHDAAVSAGS
jgi:DNA-binding PadR family transcriptional regulator